jgi:ElaB/YqjD/DUF883 family membrane-anchored ribosome-binding protein
MATTSPPTGTRGNSAQRVAANVQSHVENAYDELHEAADNLKSAARSGSKELQAAAERQVETARANARSLSRQATTAIKKRPWMAVGAALLVGAVISQALRRH